MNQPTRAAQIVDYLPTLYYRDPLLRRVVDAVAGRLADVQFDAQRVMNAHWVDMADRVPPERPQRLIDLPRLGALVPLFPFPDEEAAQLIPKTVLVHVATHLIGPGAVPLRIDQLVPGQRLYVEGSQQPDETFLATAIRVGQPSPLENFASALSGELSQIEPVTSVHATARLLLLTGQTGAEIFRQRLKLTVDAFLEGAGTAPAILKIVAATMGWGPLQETFADWSQNWTPTHPVFEAVAEGAPGPIRLRELPLRSATTPVPQRVKSGARWIETHDSAFVLQPTAQFQALDRPVVVPTLVNLDHQVAISTLIAMETVKLEGGNLVEKDVTLRLEGQPDGTLQGTLFERTLPASEVIPTNVSDRIRIRTSALRIDREGESAFLRGGTDEQAATLVVSDGRRAIRLQARSEGIWGNAIQVTALPAPSTDDEIAVALTYTPSLVVPGLSTSPASGNPTHGEMLTLNQLLEGNSLLVTAQDFTFTIPEGESRWLYFDHMGWSIFDVTQWDHTVFDAPPADVEDPEAQFASFPAKGIYSYTDFNAAVFPREFLRAFRFDQPGTFYNEAFFNETPDQVEVLLGWQEGQRATIRIDVPLETQRDRDRLGFLPEMIRKVKAAGIKVILVPRFREHQPLDEQLPTVRLRHGETQPLDDALRLRVGLRDAQSLDVRHIGIFDRDHWNAAHFD